MAKDLTCKLYSWKYEPRRWPTMNSFDQFKSSSIFQTLHVRKNLLFHSNEFLILSKFQFLAEVKKIKTKRQMFLVKYNHKTHATHDVSKRCNLDSLTFKMEEDSSFQFDIIFSTLFLVTQALMLKMIKCVGFLKCFSKKKTSIVWAHVNWQHYDEPSACHVPSFRRQNCAIHVDRNVCVSIKLYPSKRILERSNF